VVSNEKREPGERGRFGKFSAGAAAPAMKKPLTDFSHPGEVRNC
jgi:hypothetical protein